MEIIRRPLGLKTKVCTRCRQSLTVSNFVKNVRSKDGLHYTCRECSSVLSRERRELYVGNAGGR